MDGVIVDEAALDAPVVVVNRVNGIDAMRFAALVGVFFIHAAGLVPPGKTKVLAATADLAARFGVPFFFVASGYFLSRARPDFISASARSLQRILIPFAFWTAAYIVLSHDNWKQILTPKYMYHLAIGDGPGYHLWFLPSLAFCSVMLLALRRLRWRYIFAIAAAL